MSLLVTPGSFGSVVDNVTQMYGIYSVKQRSVCLQFPFRLNSLMVFTVFGHIMEKWKEIRIVRHCALATYCSSEPTLSSTQAAGDRDRQTLGSWRRLFVQEPWLLASV